MLLTPVCSSQSSKLSHTRSLEVHAKSTFKTVSGAGAETMKRLLFELCGEDDGMQVSLMDAALAVAELSNDPGCIKKRRRAAEAWRKISSLLAHHLLTEEWDLLPWAELRKGISHGLIERIGQQHRKLHELGKDVNALSFESDENEKVARTARAFFEFVVNLDDVIAGEQRDLFPILQRVLFREGPQAPAAILPSRP